MPVYFFLVFTIIEFGLMFRDNLTLAAVTRDGARGGSVVGADIDADHHILAVIEDTSAVMPAGTIQRIVVYKAASPDSPPPPACLSSGPQTGLCNVYTTADFGLPASEFGCRIDRDLDRFWCTSHRNVRQGNADYLGIYVEILRSMPTGVLGESQTMRDSFVLRLEPTDI